MVFVVGFLLTFNQAFASPFFTPLRHDHTVPEYCQDMQLSFFHLPVEQFYFGRLGAVEMGYTYEYPVSRGNASILWKYFKGLTHGEYNEALREKIQSNPELNRDYQIIMRNYEEQDFDFENEGEILEILAIEQLYQMFPENTYYITGGVEYHERNSSRTIGELDIYVGMRDSCDSVAIGETKLGTERMLNKAKDQLRRFTNFLMSHDISVVEPISQDCATPLAM